MKKKSFIIILLNLTTFSLPLIGQSSFNYIYDPTGNRISRTVTIGGGTQKSLGGLVNCGGIPSIKSLITFLTIITK